MAFFVTHLYTCNKFDNIALKRLFTRVEHTAWEFVSKFSNERILTLMFVVNKSDLGFDTML